MCLNTESPIIYYKYNKSIRNTIFNFKNVSDLYIEVNISDSWEYKDSKFCYPAAGHVGTRNLILFPTVKFDVLSLKDLDIDSSVLLNSISVAYKVQKLY